MSLAWTKKSNPLIVENPEAHSGQKYDPIYAQISPDISEDGKISNSLSFDHKKNVAFCVGINKLLTSAYAGRSEPDNTVASDAREMQAVFISYLGLSSDQVDIRIATNKSDDCTKQGLHSSFLHCAKKVEENGNFIFYYAGHGYESQDRCILSTTDFNFTDESSGITGDDLVQWLNEAECKARNVLFIFDCCYAGNLGRYLTHDNKLRIKARIFAMCGCAPSETLSSVSALGHSIFTYFLLDYFKTHDCRREFDIQQAMDEISKMCFRLSCLAFIYNRNKVIYNGAFNPILCQKHLDSDIRDRSLTKPKPEKHIISLLRTLLDNIVRESPNFMIDDWLKFPITSKSLKILLPKASISKTLQNCIVCILFCSSALIHYLHEDDDGKKLIGNRNVFLQIAIKVLDVVDLQDLTMDHVMAGLRHYITIAKKLKIDQSNLEILYKNMEEVAKKENVKNPMIPTL